MTGQELDVIEVQPAPAPMNLFGAGNPEEVVQRASEVATALAAVIQERQLFKRIGDKRHVLVDGWTLLGSMLGVFPVVVWTRQLENGWEARVEARTLSGQVVGAAEAECLRSERMWAGRDDFALRGMAQTRATSRALRGPLGFVVHLAGFAATPAEEMPDDSAARAGGARAGDAAPALARKALFAMCNEFDKDPETMKADGTKWADWVKAEAHARYGVTTRKALTKDQMIALMRTLEDAAKAEREANPFG